MQPYLAPFTTPNIDRKNIRPTKNTLYTLQWAQFELPWLISRPGGDLGGPGQLEMRRNN